MTNVEKRREKSGITLALSSMKGIVWSCLDKVAKGPQGPRCEGHPEWGRTRVRDRGHRGWAGTDVKHVAVLAQSKIKISVVNHNVCNYTSRAGSLLHRYRVQNIPIPQPGICLKCCVTLGICFRLSIRWDNAASSSRRWVIYVRVTGWRCSMSRRFPRGLITQCRGL